MADEQASEVAEARSGHEVAAPAPLPMLEQTSAARRFFSILSIVTAGSLLTAGIVRLLNGIGQFDWVLLAAAGGGMLLADFLSGLIHWSADTWGKETMPVIGHRLLHPFRVHHVNPDDFLRRSFIDTNGDVAFVAIPVLAASFWVPLGSLGNNSLSVFLVALCAIGVLTNQVHQWAHMPSPPVLVRVLQDCGIILSRHAHEKHHSPPYTASYCIATGWCNRPLQAIGFFSRMERVVSFLTGLRPREDEAGFPADLTSLQPAIAGQSETRVPHA